MTGHSRRVLRWIDATTGMRRGTIRWPDGSPPEPYGCRWCGFPARSHGALYIGPVGFHGWVTPTNEQIYARMVARRDARNTP